MTHDPPRAIIERLASLAVQSRPSLGCQQLFDTRITVRSCQSFPQFRTMKAWFLAVFCVLVATTSAIQVRDCGSKLGSFSVVSITSCQVADPVCTLARDTNVTITIDFKTNVDVPALTASVHGIVAGLPVPYPLKNPNACSESGLTCPIKAGVNQRYTGTFEVRHQYPKIHVKVRWEMKTATGDDVLCLEIPTQIKSGPPPPTVLLI